MSYGSFFYGIVAGAPAIPEYGEYGIVVNINYYGIFTRKQAQRRIRRINRQIRLRSAKLARMRVDITGFRRSPQSYFSGAGWQMSQIKTLRKMRGKIAKRWNLKRSGAKKKGGGRFLFWKKKR